MSLIMKMTCMTQSNSFKRWIWSEALQRPSDYLEKLGHVSPLLLIVFYYSPRTRLYLFNRQLCSHSIPHQFRYLHPSESNSEQERRKIEEYYTQRQLRQRKDVWCLLLILRRLLFYNQKMKKAKKVIQNYQIIDTLQEYENEYEILLAKHTTEKKFYVLKKLSIKQGNNQALYQGLLNEAKLLKILNHENIVKCFRMLKTSNNIYLAYTYHQGTTLEELLEEGPKSLTFIQKETIAKQLCLVLSEQQKSDIAHLNITPENIIVNEESAIMVREFIYGMQIPEEGEVEIERKVPKSPFIAPEVRRGIACLDADIYSMGKILEKLEFKKCKKDTNSSVDHSKRIETILNLIDAMTVKDRTERITLNEVYQTLFPNKKKVKRLRSLSEGGMQSSYLSSSSMSSSKSQFGSKQAYAEILMKILRHRNISWFLLRLFKRIVVNIKLNSELTVILGVIMLKKSTKLLASLGKYLHYGRNDIGIDINAKDQTRFFKTTDYHKICEIIDKQIALQKKDLDTAVETVYINNSALLKTADFNRELKEEQTNQKYFDKCIKEYLTDLTSKANILDSLDDEIILDLYLMSFIVYFQGVENFFRQRILIEPCNFDEQLFVKKAKEMSRALLLESMKANLEPKVIEI